MEEIRDIAPEYLAVYGDLGAAGCRALNVLTGDSSLLMQMKPSLDQRHLLAENNSSATNNNMYPDEHLHLHRVQLPQ